ncbi:phage portal protein [Afifella sp. YEN Y35]|uniref:phage portal protein n=1 Tax=Afifella sp. YEN Y35 TaxID=3388337 RepID=UPI0039E040B5
MSLFDKALAAVSPGAALKRMYYRTQLQEAQRAFDAAKVGRRTDSWRATNASANAETALGLDRVRARSRELVRNNAHAAQIVRALAAHMVGTQITCQPVGLGKRVSAQVRRNWTRFVSTADPVHGLNWNALLHLAARTIVESGEVLFVWHDTDDIDAPIEVHVLEPDHLDTGKNEALANGGSIIQGVEFDASGRRVAYWLFDRHPGEPVIPTGTPWQSRRVTADRVDHVFDVLRPGQVRGIPWLAPVALRMRDAAEAEEAELIRLKIQSCFTAFVRRDPDASNAIGQVEAEAGTGRHIERMSPGLIHRLGIGEDVTFGTPNATAGLDNYLKGQYRAICVGVGVPYALGTGDISDANYSNQREGKIQFWQLLDHWQWDMLVPMGLDRAWRRVHQAHARLGQGPREVPQVDYAMPRRPWVDPLKDGLAAELELRLGGSTWAQFIGERGYDPATQADEIETWNPRINAMGLDFGWKNRGAEAGQNGNAPANSQSGQNGSEVDMLRQLMADGMDFDRAVSAIGEMALIRRLGGALGEGRLIDLIRAADAHQTSKEPGDDT